MAYNLLPTQLSQDCCHSDLHSSLKAGFKSVGAILISVTGPHFAAETAFSFPGTPTWLGIQRNTSESMHAKQL